MSESAPRVPGEMPQDDPRIGSTVVVGLVSIILLVVILLGLEALYYRTAERARVQKIVEVESPELARVHGEQRERLRGYRWIDRERGIVALPIEQGMRLVIAEAPVRRGAGERP